MKINSNMQAVYTQSILAYNEEKMSKATQKMSSGYTINRAKDNPAGMAISNRMRSRLKSLERVNQNSKNAINTVQTTDGGLAEIEDMLQRMNELAVRASNGLNADSDRSAIQEEINQLTDEIERISRNTTYNTQSLLDGSQALKGFVTDNAKDYSVRNYNEDFPNGDYKITFEMIAGDDGKATMDSLTLYDEKSKSDVDVKTYEITTFYDDYENPTKMTGASVKLTLTGGGEITLDARLDKDLDKDPVTNEIKDTKSGKIEFNFETRGYGGMKIQTGADEGQEVQIVIPEVSVKTINFIDLDGKRTLDLYTEESAKKSIEKIGKAIDYVSAVRAKVGAYQNRIEKTISNLDSTIENLTESYSTIKDLDMAEGMVEYTTLQVLVQAGNSMLAQANEQPQQALQLLQ